jgi:hypothetical protein
MSWFIERRGALTLGGVALSVGLSVILIRGGSTDEAPRVRAESSQDRAPAAAPYRERLYPLARAAAPAPEEAPLAEPTADVAPPPRQIPGADIKVWGDAPPAPRQTASGWIASYREAVCGCATRACVRALQPRFVQAIGGTDYDEERDGAAYAAASREAIKCYASLPADS